MTFFPYKIPNWMTWSECPFKEKEHCRAWEKIRVCCGIPLLDEIVRVLRPFKEHIAERGKIMGSLGKSFEIISVLRPFKEHIAERGKIMGFL